MNTKHIHNHDEQEKKQILEIYNNNILNNNDITCLLYDPKLKLILSKAKKEEKSIIGHDIMNLLDSYSKILINNNNINKHETKENKKNKEEDFKYIKLGEKNPIGPKENDDLLYHIDIDKEHNSHIQKEDHDKDIQ